MCIFRVSGRLWWRGEGMRRGIQLSLIASGLLASGCSQPAEEMGSVAVSLASGSAKQLLACEDAFDEVSADRFEDGEGAKWAWSARADGTLSHYCRRERSTQLSAWEEASSDTATHKLTFNWDQAVAVFQPLPPR